MKEAILFDLDGTLVTMDNDEFTKVYFGLLARKLAPYGYEAEKLIGAIWQGTKSMVKNDGSCMNAEAFWKTFRSLYPEKDIDKDMPLFEEFYENEFAQSRSATVDNPLAKVAVAAAREKAEKVILATNPLFPASAVKERLSWIGLEMSDFDLVTSYEYFGHTKPNPEYFSDIMKKMNLNPKNCVMIGNDVEEDYLTTQVLGLDGFIVNTNVIGDIAKVEDGHSGSFEDAIEYIRNLD